eukprot:TRINITY_DN453_c1_g2_i1.p1 TRINITY_DN453_c1_g2~~TRINITY_DN453_c1_g2_i1.p1  ORF type:complete len:382 (+),score=48.40 TRINITY_DN453_c1_g2_i1:1222-2367(+)
MPPVTTILSDSGFIFKHVIDVTPTMGFSEFKDKVEQHFDLRLQLSFKKKGEPSGYVGGVESLDTTILNTTAGSTNSTVSRAQVHLEALLKKSRIKPTNTSQVALSDKTWLGFISRPRPTCRAWSIFPGVSLKSSSTKPLTKEERIQQFEAGSESLTNTERLKALKKKLRTMHLNQQRKEEHASLGCSLNLFKSLAQEQRDATVERLWRHATDRNKRRSEEEQLESERIIKRLVQPPRNLVRTPDEEATIDRLFEQPLQRRALLGTQLDTKYTPLFNRPPTLPPREVGETVHRLYSDASENERRRQEAHQRIYGLPAEERKLSPEQLRVRLQSLYTTAIDKKNKKLKELSVTYSSPKATTKVLSPEAAKLMSERLCQPITGK